VCAVAADTIEMRFTPSGMYQARLKDGHTLSAEDEQRVSAVCPFSARARSEDEIAGALFARHCKQHPEIGFHAETYSGYVVEGDYRERGSSGGMGTWLAAELLRVGLVDAVLHVKPGGENRAERSLLFQFAISRSLDDLRDGAQSRYYPITLSDVLQRVKADPDGRYAIIGVPCFVKAVRLLAEQDPVVGRAVRFCIGLVCGHLKSAAFAEFLAWQGGIEPGSVSSFSFRHKLQDRNARHYGFRATGAREGANVEITKPMDDVFGGDWGLGFFKYKACDFCDDVLAETADVVVGDAWLEPYDRDWRGTNVLVVRNVVFADLLSRAAAEGRVSIAPLSADDVAKSQRSGLRHRREGLSSRLVRAERRGDWHPPKRVGAGSIDVTSERRRTYELREELRELSHSAFAEARDKGEFSVFLERMRPTVERYYRTFQQPLAARVRNRIKRLLSGFLGNLS
jgi:coenzyme F420-reducing hydrogenase beta subunit